MLYVSRVCEDKVTSFVEDIYARLAMKANGKQWEASIWFGNRFQFSVWLLGFDHISISFRSPICLIEQKKPYAFVLCSACSAISRHKTDRHDTRHSKEYGPHNLSKVIGTIYMWAYVSWRAHLRAFVDMTYIIHYTM